MIESKTLGSAAGVQYQGVIDKTETASLPALANGVIIGRFKRGRMDKSFKVTASNYQAVLGRDPSNPSYLVVEDAFKRGISEVSILRTGATGSVVSDGDTSAGGGGGNVIATPEQSYQMTITSDNSPNGNVGMSIEIVGVEGSCKVYRDEVLISSGDYALGDDSVYIPLNDLGGKTVGINVFVDKAESLKVNSDWTSDFEDSGRVIDVNNFVEGVSSINFAVWSVHLNVPNTLPTSVTSLKSMFESCINFNSDLSNWNTSNVTSMENTFSGCEIFESDLSSWDVSKVESFRYAFSGASSFNSDLSGWDTSSATDMFRMFSTAKNFTSIVEDWDVSNVLDMDYMFQLMSGEPPILPPQDLSKWCVTNISFEPMDFIGYGWAGTLPIWGTCPSR